MKVKNKLGMSLVMKIYGVWSSSSALLLAKNDYNFQFSCLTLWEVETINFNGLSIEPMNLNACDTESTSKCIHCSGYYHRLQ